MSIVRKCKYEGLWGGGCNWGCNKAVTACIILTIEAAIKYAPPGGAIVTIHWVLNIPTQDVVHTVTC